MREGVGFEAGTFTGPAGRKEGRFDRPTTWRLAAETAGDLFGKWAPIAVVVLVILPASALAAASDGPPEYDRLVAVLTALGVAASSVVSAWNHTKLRNSIQQISTRRLRGRRRQPGARLEVPALRSAAAQSTVTGPGVPAALGTIERLDARIASVEADIGTLKGDVGEVKRDLTEILDVLTGRKAP